MASWAIEFEDVGLQRAYEDKGFVFAFVMMWQCDALYDVLVNLGIVGTGHYLDDTSRTITRKLFDVNTDPPQTLFIDRKMRIRYHEQGFDPATSPSIFIDHINELLAE